MSGIPPAFLDLAERAWQAGRNYRPLDDQDETRLRELSQQAGAVFQADELATRVNWPQRHRGDGPHDGCPGMMS